LIKQSNNKQIACKYANTHLLKPIKKKEEEANKKKLYSLFLSFFLPFLDLTLTLNFF